MSGVEQRSNVNHDWIMRLMYWKKCEPVFWWSSSAQLTLLFHDFSICEEREHKQSKNKSMVKGAENELESWPEGKNARVLVVIELHC
jgi:hypothetical protein